MFSSSNSPTTSTRSHTRIITLTGLVILSLALASGLWAYRTHRIEDCKTATTTYTTALHTYEKAYKSASTTAHTIPTADSVADQTTYTAFHTAYTTKPPTTVNIDCNPNLISMWSMDTTPLNAASSKLTSLAKTLTSATSAVEKSHETKLINDARSMAQQKLDEATALYTSSENQVADNTTRNTLKGILDTLQNTISDTNATVDSLTSATNPVQGAVDAVNQSKEAKKVADEQKAREEAEAQARAAQQAQAAANARNANRRNTRNNGVNRNTTNSTPRRSGGNNTPAPAQSTNSSNDDDLSWWYEWKKNQPESPCVARGTCHLITG